MALNGLFGADVPLRNYRPISHSRYTMSTVLLLRALDAVPAVDLTNPRSRCLDQLRTDNNTPLPVDLCRRAISRL